MRSAVRLGGLLAIVASACVEGATADWLNEGGDARRSNHQPLEREISPATAANLKLIWKRKLGAKKLGGNAILSSPVILGRLITYRGTVELMFVSSSDGTVYAVDGDFGTVFWTRQLDSQALRCPTPATPALTPNPPGADPDDDGPQPMRPLYVLAPDAMLHALDPIQGRDFAPARQASCAASLVVRKGKALAAKSSPRFASWRDDQGVRRKNPNAVVAGGVAFVLTKATGELEAFDALTGRRLYRSEPTSPSPGSLAVANGHVCFTGSDSTLYCFGFPLER